MMDNTTIVLNKHTTLVLENLFISINNWNMKLSERLIKARKMARLSQQELALRIGCSQGAISKIERGDQANSSLLVKIASACNVNPIWLDTGVGNIQAEFSYGSLTPKQITMLKIMQELPEYQQDVLIRVGGSLSEPLEEIKKIN